jgi:acetyl esterase/lipase
LAGTIPSAISNLKAVSLLDGDIGIAFSAPVNKDGELINPKNEPKPKHSAREYTGHPVRVWDTWEPNYHFNVFISKLTKEEGKWKWNKNAINILKDTEIKFPAYAGAIMGEGGSYDVSSSGILISTTAPENNPAMEFSYAMYFIKLKTFQESHFKIVRLRIPEYEGMATAPSFSPDGKFAAFIVAKYKNRPVDQAGIAVLHVEHAEFTGTASAFYKLETEKEKTWDRLPTTLTWSNDSKTLYIQANDSGYGRLFQLDLDTQNLVQDPIIATLSPPKRLTGDGSVAFVRPISTTNLKDKRLLISSTSFTDSSFYTILNPIDGSQNMVSSISNSGANYGISHDQVKSITYKGDKDYPVQAFIICPSDFDPKKKYPLCLIIHGGPQSAWNDSWTTRWNIALFAEQGYIVAAPNPAGSVGFGFEFTNAVDGDWGGRPYRDIAALFNHIEADYSYVDTSRAVLAGASYGGYMANWVAGQPLAKKLKAIVSHDGIFSNISMLASDFIPTLQDDIGAHIWEDPKLWEKFSPSSFTMNWKTPMLIIHSDNDFRCPINEGLAAYAVCRARGIESRFLNFPNENHFVLGRENSLKWYHTVLGWINKFLDVEEGIVLDEIE